MIKGIRLIKKTFEMFGLEMHIGRGNTPSKTECVFFPKPDFFSVPKTIQCEDVNGNCITTNGKKRML